MSFDGYIGIQHKGGIKIDLATGSGMTAEVTTAEPANHLELPRLVSHPYRLYPLVDQIADKVCAVHQLHDGRPSSREKDLVDLAVIALTQPVELASLKRALAAGTRQRRMDPIIEFEIPSTWGRGYAKLAKPVPYLAAYPTAAHAAELVADFLQPTRTAMSMGLWSPDRLAWE